MYSYLKLALLCVILHAVWAPDFALADDEPSTWSIYQFNGIDDLFMQIRTAELESQNRVPPDYEWMLTVCEGIKDTAPFQSFARSNFETYIRGKLSPVNQLPPEMKLQPELAEYQPYLNRYDLTVPNVAVFTLDLYECASDGTGTKYSISHGYERDSLFFLFAHDPVTDVASLKAIVQEDATVRKDDMSDLMWSYVVRRQAFLTVFKKKSVGIEDDTICMLSDLDKLRLCSMVLDTPYYSSDYRFTPMIENVGDCSAFDLDRKSVFGQDVEQLMFPCMATSINNPSVAIPIYVSRNYVKHGVTGYTEVDRRRYIVRPDAFFTNIFFVSEPYQEKIDRRVKRAASASRIPGFDGNSDAGGYTVGNVAQSDMADAAAAAMVSMTASSMLSSLDGDAGDGGGADGGGGK